jgi:hypothetical protein
MHILAGISAGYPLGGALLLVQRRYQPISSLCPFQEYIRSFFLVKGKKPLIECLALFLADPYHHLTTSFAELLYAPAGYLSKRVSTTNHHPRYTMRNDKVGARGRLAIMAARL